MASWFDLEGAIVARLRQALDAKGFDQVRILTRSDLASIKAGQHPTPAIDVIYRGYGVPASYPITRIEQTWLTVPVVRNVVTARSGQSARDEAGPLIDICLDAIGTGGRIAEGFGPMKLKTGPAPAQDLAGLSFFPLAWGVTHTRTPTCLSS